jgi:methyl-accepting chemotaxis protein
MKTAITRGEHLNGAFRLLRGNGQEAWLRSILQPVKNSEGRIKYFTLHSSDLTRTIETSREHESLIKALMRSTAVIEFDLDGRCSLPTTVSCTVGYSLEQVRGKHHRMFCEPEEANSAGYQAFWDKLRRGEYVAERFKRIDAHGRVIWLEASYNLIFDAHDVLYKVVKFATVITDQVNQEQAVARRRTLPTTPRWDRQQRAQGHRRGDPDRGRDARAGRLRCRRRPRASRRWTAVAR